MKRRMEALSGAKERNRRGEKMLGFDYFNLVLDKRGVLGDNIYVSPCKLTGLYFVQ